MSNVNSELSPQMEQAIELLKAGQTVEAEELMAQTAAEVERRCGERHPDTAAAYNELGTILMNVDNVQRAAEAYRKACAGPLPTDNQALRDRLTFLMNLGMALQMAREYDEAEQVYRDGLQGRAQYYGSEHPGYAFGLEPLGHLLLARGKSAEAVEAFEATVANFWNNGHPRITTAMALRAEAYKHAGRSENPFVGAEQLPDELLSELAGNVIGRMREADPGVLSHVMQDLLPLLEQRFGPDHDVVRNGKVCIVNMEGDRGQHCNHDLRLRLGREVIASHERQGAHEEALQDVQGYAKALSDAGQPEQAIAAYRQAVDKARGLRQPTLQSQIRRNLGLLLSELDRDAEAQTELAGAVDDASYGTDEEMRSRAEVALGIFYQHRQQLELARPLLTRALQHLNPAHGDAVIARSHLHALQDGRTCGCDDQGKAMAEAFREFVVSRLPKDLLEEFGVKLADKDFQLSVRLNREPTEAELEHLNRVIQHALAEFRKQILTRS